MCSQLTKSQRCRSETRPSRRYLFRYQKPLLRYLESGGKRADIVAHRRWGKDEVALHWAAIRALRRPGVYWHLLPEASQGRKAIWDAVNPHTGKRRIDEAFPPSIRTRWSIPSPLRKMSFSYIGGKAWSALLRT